ncbi:uncharacterized protein [Miscanthus floridulus]|uniref:uncharacterized protein n=1 Tax=Miscanthus floridulus TaxID=154761 RepID=UPI00345923DA
MVSFVTIRFRNSSQPLIRSLCPPLTPSPGASPISSPPPPRQPRTSASLLKPKPAPRLRAAALDEYERAHEALWAQATAVVNVKALIPVVLDQAANTYTKWRSMFLTVLGKYALTYHVLEDEAFPSRPAWVQADCCVLTWIYDTVSRDLQQSLMMRQGPARGAWCYLEDEFLGQKESRALLLETKFRNFRQESLSITDYCRQLESMAASLAEFGEPIGDRQMVLTLLHGLSGKFRHMVSILKMHRPFPTFAEARTHLLLEEMEIDARPPSPPSALVAATPRPAAPGAPGALHLHARERLLQHALLHPPVANALAAAAAANAEVNRLLLADTVVPP